MPNTSMREKNRAALREKRRAAARAASEATTKVEEPNLAGKSSRIAIVARFVLGFTFAIIATLAIWPYLPKRYASEAKVVMLTDIQDGIPDPSKAARAFPDEAITQSQIDLLASPLLAAKVVDICHLIDDPEFTQENELIHFLRSFPVLEPFLPQAVPVTAETVRLKLEKRLSLKRDRKSYSVDFGYWSRNPERAAQMTQALLDAFVTMQRDHRREAMTRISSWLDARVSAVREQAQKSEDAVRSFMDSSGLVDEGAQDLFQHELAELGAAKGRAETDRVRATIDAETLLAMKKANRLQDAPQVVLSPSIQKLREQLATAFSLRPDALVPQANVLNTQLAAESERIVQAAVIAARDAQRRKDALETEIVALRGKIADRARARLHLDQLRREAQANANVLSAALERAHERTDLAMSIAPEVQIAGLPEPAPKPSFPNPLLGLIGTLLMGCLCGILLNWREASAAVVARGSLATKTA